MSRIRYSEIFFSFQGEAELAGVPAVWLRFFGCNLNCHGFGQIDPTNAATYVLPFENFNLDNVKSVEELPVWKFGCDSSYSWSSRYKHLANDVDISELANRLVDANKSEHNPLGLFTHPKTNQPIMLCFTGGEPMLQQDAIMDTLRELHRRDNMPRIVTVETNATRPLSNELRRFIAVEFRNMGGERWHWAMSPKLFTVSGETGAIKPEIIQDYARETISSSVLKFVCNGTAENWNELDFQLKTLKLRFGMGELPPIWIMPVGATKDVQEHPDIADLCVEAMQRGFNVATRNQVYIFGNIIGR
jgi:organic radical activating enzyme